MPDAISFLCSFELFCASCFHPNRQCEPFNFDASRLNMFKFCKTYTKLYTYKCTFGSLIKSMIYNLTIYSITLYNDVCILNLLLSKIVFFLHFWLQLVHNFAVDFLTPCGQKCGFLDFWLQWSRSISSLPFP